MRDIGMKLSITYCVFVLMISGAAEAKILIEYNASQAAGLRPDQVAPAWEGRGQFETVFSVQREFLLQQTGLGEYGQFISPKAPYGTMLKGNSEYGIEVKVKPLSDMKTKAQNESGNIFVFWSDDVNWYVISIDKYTDDKLGTTGSVNVQANPMIPVITNIDWSVPHTIFIGYNGTKDVFNFYLDGVHKATIKSESVADRKTGTQYIDRVGFGDGAVTGVCAAYRAEWYFIKVYDNMDVQSKHASSEDNGKSVILADGTGKPFSLLDDAEKLSLRKMAKFPAIAKRYGCYSTPMYYLFCKGYEYRGGLDANPDKRQHLQGHRGVDYGHWSLPRNRPDWQEVLMRDWVELGLNSIHLDLGPTSKNLEFPDTNQTAAIEDFIQLSEQYGIKVGVRLNAVGDYENWPMHPNNPDNVTEKYLLWVKHITSLLKGRMAYYVLGDELNLKGNDASKDPRAWTPEVYARYFKKLASAVKEVDPNAKVSMFACTAGAWPYVMELLNTDYVNIADGVALNYYRTKGENIRDYVKGAKKHNLLFLSNGMGYCSSAAASPRYPDGDSYYRWGSDKEQGYEISKQVWSWWDAGADVAPYYIYARNWVIRGKVYPYWYGFFGFADMVIDEHDNMTIKRYPGWYAFQTIAHTFYNRQEFTEPKFKVTPSAQLSMFKAYEHKVQGGSELVLIMWNDSPKTIHTEITIDSKAYMYPVRINLFNYNDWLDVPYDVIADQRVVVKVDVGLEPVIIRLFSSCAQKNLKKL